ncbi:hypothetical protein I553_9612 [Mycobacterium xenopi 4042]|uniref:Uncharacterized protein n=1 Tax=Mycobacterium xenopi 4042 TaxID=1299334 RepID=X8DZP2_MYCXE|nr:hypothetical protein I553_9612 [Mycobacterium xenopi 4042]
MPYESLSGGPKSSWASWCGWLARRWSPRRTPSRCSSTTRSASPTLTGWRKWGGVRHGRRRRTTHRLDMHPGSLRRRAQRAPYRPERPAAPQSRVNPIAG